MASERWAGTRSQGPLRWKEGKPDYSKSKGKPVESLDREVV